MSDKGKNGRPAQAGTGDDKWVNSVERYYGLGNSGKPADDDTLSSSSSIDELWKYVKDKSHSEKNRVRAGQMIWNKGIDAQRQLMGGDEAVSRARDWFGASAVPAGPPEARDVAAWGAWQGDLPVNKRAVYNPGPGDIGIDELQKMIAAGRLAEVRTPEGATEIRAVRNGSVDAVPLYVQDPRWKTPVPVEYSKVPDVNPAPLPGAMPLSPAHLVSTIIDWAKKSTVGQEPQDAEDYERAVKGPPPGNAEAFMKGLGNNMLQEYYNTAKGVFDRSSVPAGSVENKMLENNGYYAGGKVGQDIASTILLSAIGAGGMKGLGAGKALQNAGGILGGVMPSWKNTAKAYNNYQLSSPGALRQAGIDLVSAIPGSLMGTGHMPWLKMLGADAVTGGATGALYAANKAADQGRPLSAEELLADAAVSAAMMAGMSTGTRVGSKLFSKAGSMLRNTTPEKIAEAVDRGNTSDQIADAAVAQNKVAPENRNAFKSAVEESMAEAKAETPPQPQGTQPQGTQPQVTPAAYDNTMISPIARRIEKGNPNEVFNTQDALIKAGIVKPSEAGGRKFVNYVNRENPAQSPVMGLLRVANAYDGNPGEKSPEQVGAIIDRIFKGDTRTVEAQSNPFEHIENLAASGMMDESARVENSVLAFAEYTKLLNDIRDDFSKAYGGLLRGNAEFNRAVKFNATDAVKKKMNPVDIAENAAETLYADGFTDEAEALCRRMGARSPGAKQEAAAREKMSKKAAADQEKEAAAQEKLEKQKQLADEKLRIKQEAEEKKLQLKQELEEKKLKLAEENIRKKQEIESQRPAGPGPAGSGPAGSKPAGSKAMKPKVAEPKPKATSDAAVAKSKAEAASKAAASKTQAPKTQAPKTQASKAQAPKAQATKTQAAKTQTAKAKGAKAREVNTRKKEVKNAEQEGQTKQETGNSEEREGGGTPVGKTGEEVTEPKGESDGLQREKEAGDASAQGIKPQEAQPQEAQPQKVQPQKAQPRKAQPRELDLTKVKKAGIGKEEVERFVAGAKAWFGDITGKPLTPAARDRARIDILRSEAARASDNPEEAVSKGLKIIEDDARNFRGDARLAQVANYAGKNTPPWRVAAALDEGRALANRASGKNNKDLESLFKKYGDKDVAVIASANEAIYAERAMRNIEDVADEMHITLAEAQEVMAAPITDEELAKASIEAAARLGVDPPERSALRQMWEDWRNHTNAVSDQEFLSSTAVAMGVIPDAVKDAGFKASFDLSSYNQKIDENKKHMQRIKKAIKAYMDRARNLKVPVKIDKKVKAYYKTKYGINLDDANYKEQIKELRKSITQKVKIAKKEMAGFEGNIKAIEKTPGYILAKTNAGLYENYERLRQYTRESYHVKHNEINTRNKPYVRIIHEVNPDGSKPNPRDMRYKEVQRFSTRKEMDDSYAAWAEKVRARTLPDGKIEVDGMDYQGNKIIGKDGEPVRVTVTDRKFNEEEQVALVNATKKQVLSYLQRISGGVQANEAASARAAAEGRAVIDELVALSREMREASDDIGGADVLDEAAALLKDVIESSNAADQWGAIQKLVMTMMQRRQPNYYNYEAYTVQHGKNVKEMKQAIGTQMDCDNRRIERWFTQSKVLPELMEQMGERSYYNIDNKYSRWLSSFYRDLSTSSRSTLFGRGIEVGNRRIKPVEALNGLMRWNAVARMGLNFGSATKNYLAGTHTAFVNAAINGNWISYAKHGPSSFARALARFRASGKGTPEFMDYLNGHVDFSSKTRNGFIGKLMQTLEDDGVFGENILNEAFDKANATQNFLLSPMRQAERIIRSQTAMQEIQASIDKLPRAVRARMFADEAYAKQVLADARQAVAASQGLYHNEDLSHIERTLRNSDARMLFTMLGPQIHSWELDATAVRRMMRDKNFAGLAAIIAQGTLVGGVKMVPILGEATLLFDFLSKDPDSKLEDSGVKEGWTDKVVRQVYDAGRSAGLTEEQMDAMRIAFEAGLPAYLTGMNFSMDEGVNSLGSPFAVSSMSQTLDLFRKNGAAGGFEKVFEKQLLPTIVQRAAQAARQVGMGSFTNSEGEPLSNRPYDWLDAAKTIYAGKDIKDALPVILSMEGQKPLLTPEDKSKYVAWAVKDMEGSSDDKAEFARNKNIYEKYSRYIQSGIIKKYEAHAEDMARAMRLIDEKLKGGEVGELASKDGIEDYGYASAEGNMKTKARKAISKFFAAEAKAEFWAEEQAKGGELGELSSSLSATNKLREKLESDDMAEAAAEYAFMPVEKAVKKDEPGSTKVRRRKRK